MDEVNITCPSYTLGYQWAAEFLSTHCLPIVDGKGRLILSQQRVKIFLRRVRHDIC